MANNRVSTMLDGNANYEAYRDLNVLPLGANEWSEDEDGLPIVHLGEARCREPIGGGHLCGRKFSKRNNLVNHLRRIHGIDDVSPSAHGVGIPKGEHIMNEMAWYGALMDEHRRLAAPAQQAAQQQQAHAAAAAAALPPWPVIWLPNGEMDVVRMSQVCVALGRPRLCPTCDAEEGEEDADQTRCTFFRDSDFWKCENRAVWEELVEEDDRALEQGDGEQEEELEEPEDDGSSILSSAHPSLHSMPA